MLARLSGAKLAGEPPSSAVSGRSSRFARVKRLMEEPAGEVIRGLTDKHPTLVNEEAQRLPAAALNSYAPAAVLMPYAPFLETAEESRYDLDRLSQRFDISYEQAAHRLATLQRPGAAGLRFAFMRSDPSGYVTKRLPLPRLPLPRYGTACPLWVVYGAFQSPGVTVRS